MKKILALLTFALLIILPSNVYAEGKELVACKYESSIGSSKKTIEIKYNSGSKKWAIVVDNKIIGDEYKDFSVAFSSSEGEYKILYLGDGEDNFACPSFAIAKDKYVCFGSSFNACNDNHNFGITEEEVKNVKSSISVNVISDVNTAISKAIGKVDTTKIKTWLNQYVGEGPLGGGQHLANRFDTEVINAITEIVGSPIPSFVMNNSNYRTRSKLIQNKLQVFISSSTLGSSTFSEAELTLLKNAVKYAPGTQENNDNDATKGGCDTLFGDPKDNTKIAYWLQFVLNIMKYAAIVALLVLTSIDFFKAIVQNDKDALLKAAQTAGKRLVFAILIFFLPVIVEVLMTLIGAYGTCGIG